jgi:hypothetical protein
VVFFLSGTWPETLQGRAALSAWGFNDGASMPVLLVPILLGIPVLFVGGYYVIKSFN